MNKDNKLDDISDLLKQYDKNVNTIINNNSDTIKKDNNTLDSNLKENIKLERLNVDDKKESEEINKIDNSSSKTISFNNNVSNNIDLHTPVKNNEKVSLSNTNNNKPYISFELRLGFRILLFIIFCVSFIFLMFKYLSYNKNTNEYYSENSQSGYSVCLEENEFYEESCLGEDRQYLSKLVNNITYIFSYNSLYSYNVEKVYNYYVSAHLKIFSQDNDSQILFEKIFNLVDKKEIKNKSTTFTIADDIVIPFNDYQKLVTKYNNDYGVLSIAEVVVDFYVNDKSVSSLTIPLGKQTFSIAKHDTSNTVLVDNDIKKTIKKTNTILLVFMLICGIMSIISLLVLLKFFMKFSKKKDDVTKYRNEVKTILKNYDRIIVEVEDISKLLDNKIIIKVENFLELVDVRDTLDKPILHVKINNIKDGFYVDEGNKIYSFIMKSK